MHCPVLLVISIIISVYAQSVVTQDTYQSTQDTYSQSQGFCMIHALAQPLQRTTFQALSAIKSSAGQSAAHFATIMARGRQSTFHQGEIQAQELAGVREHVLESGLEAFVREAMPTQHRDFYETQPLMYLSSQAADGSLWASVIAGRPGFVSSPSATKLTVSPLHVSKGDPLARNLAVGSHLGGLGLELHTRRRNRINTHVTQVDLPVSTGGDKLQLPGSMELEVELSFGNCPKYIQGRHLAFDWARLGELNQRVEEGGAQLGPAQTRQVLASDTLFLATSYNGPAENGVIPASVGCDMSHRGGPTGFVLVQQAPGGGTVLKWADYVGNNMFQSLGNLLTNPRAGLLFIDYATGDTLQLSGRAVADWDDQSLPGAMRVVSFTVEQWVHVPGALPMRQVGGVDFSRFLPEPLPAQLDPTDAAVASTLTLPVTCVSVTEAAVGIKTFEFALPQEAKDPNNTGKGADATPYLGGQYGTFLVHDAGAGAPPTQRSWTISSHPATTQRTGTFTITVKRAGRISSWLHDNLQPGMNLLFKGFGGDFTARLALCPGCAAGTAIRPPGCPTLSGTLLLAGGIGITPMLPILQDLVDKAVADAATCVPYRLVLAYWVKEVPEAALAKDLHAIAESAAARSNGRVAVQLVLVATRAAQVDAAPQLGQLWQRGQGHLSADFLSKYLLPNPGTDGGLVPAAPLLSNWHVFTCGPAGFLAAAEQAVEALGANMSNAHTESFNF